MDNPSGDTSQEEQSSVNFKNAKISEEENLRRGYCEAIPRPISENLLRDPKT